MANFHSWRSDVLEMLDEVFMSCDVLVWFREVMQVFVNSNYLEAKHTHTTNGACAKSSTF